MKRRGVLIGSVLCIALGLGWVPGRAAERGEWQLGSESSGQPSVRTAVTPDTWWRFGVVAPLGVTGYEAQLEDLKAGAYLDFGRSLSPARPGGIEYIHVLRVRDDIYPSVLSELSALVAANPGASWEVGNEPDTTYENQDNLPPETYADRYYAIATQILSLDSSASVGFGTVVQPTPIRLRYLERAWLRLIDLAESQAAASALISFWNVHAFVLNEWPGQWGTGVPPGFLCSTHPVACSALVYDSEVVQGTIRNVICGSLEFTELTEPVSWPSSFPTRRCRRPGMVPSPGGQSPTIVGG